MVYDVIYDKFMWYGFGILEYSLVDVLVFGFGGFYILVIDFWGYGDSYGLIYFGIYDIFFFVMFLFYVVLLIKMLIDFW